LSERGEERVRGVKIEDVKSGGKFQRTNVVAARMGAKNLKKQTFLSYLKILGSVSPLTELSRVCIFMSL
jgi:hypothetical protein